MSLRNETTKTTTTSINAFISNSCSRRSQRARARPHNRHRCRRRRRLSRRCCCWTWSWTANDVSRAACRRRHRRTRKKSEPQFAVRHSAASARGGAYTTCVRASKRARAHTENNSRVFGRAAAGRRQRRRVAPACRRLRSRARLPTTAVVVAATSPPPPSPPLVTRLAMASASNRVALMSALALVVVFAQLVTASIFNFGGSSQRAADAAEWTQYHDQTSMERALVGRGAQVREHDAPLFHRPIG